MLFCRSRALTFSPLSLGNFIKHLPNSSLNLSASGFNPKKSKKCYTTAALRSSQFDNLTEHQKSQVHLYVDSLLQWNQKMNLTAVREENEVMERHVEDSLAIIEPIRSSYISHCGDSWENINLVDVGSGAGLPGLILAIACPGWKVTLLESMNKRCVFLEHAISATGLSNVQVIWGRAETRRAIQAVTLTPTENQELPSLAVPAANPSDQFCNFGQNPGFREIFDVAVARAVAEMRVLAEFCLPLVRVGGLFIAAKGHNPEEEVKLAERAVRLMGASVLQTCTVESHSKYGQRTAIICLKDGTTPRKYPRDPGIPTKSPL